MTNFIKRKSHHLHLSLILLSVFIVGFTASPQCSSNVMDRAAQREQAPNDDHTPVTFDVEGNRAFMNGEIDETTPDLVRDLHTDNPEVTIIVMEEVPGSVDDDANLVASRLVRSYGFTTFVPSDGLIASGGVDFFIAGVERIAEPGAQIGVHSWAGDNISGADLPRDDPEHNKYLAYYAEMGIAANFYWFTLEAAPPADIYYMTENEIDQYGVRTRSSISSQPVSQPVAMIFLPLITR